MKFFPQVKQLELTGGRLGHSTDIPFRHTRHSKKVKNVFIHPFREADEREQIVLKFNHDASLGNEAYRIKITYDNIFVYYATERGIFYAMKTLNQISKQNKYEFPCLEIFDEPELEVRGFMLDISRNKIPKLSTLKTYVDLLSDLKYNHLELYVEGFSYKYPSFDELYQDDMTPLTPKEYRELEKYANRRMIDLVPCHNGLGHMTAWLKHYPELAIAEDSVYVDGTTHKVSTIDPLNPKSLELVQSFYKDALINSKSNYFHMNLDEPYDLGYDDQEDEEGRVRVGQMYLDYVLKLYDFVKSYGKTPMMWGDVLNHYPELIKKLPKDLIFVDWGYESDYPFYKNLKRLKDHNIPFLAAPGTSSWNSITGRKQTMLENIKQACLFAKENDGLGILLTDWGDNGHLQTFVASLPGIVYGALEAWRGHIDNSYDMKQYIDIFVMNNPEQKVGQLILDLASYNQYETSYTKNETELMEVIKIAQTADKNRLQDFFFFQLKTHPYGYFETPNRLTEHLEQIEKHYKTIKLKGSVGRLYQDEILLSIKMVKALIYVILTQHQQTTNDQYVTYKKWLHLNYPRIIKAFERIWKRRNKLGGLKDSMAILHVIGMFVEEIQNYNFMERNPGIVRRLPIYKLRNDAMN